MKPHDATVLDQPVGAEVYIIGQENGQLIGRIVRSQSREDLLEILRDHHSHETATAQRVGIPLSGGNGDGHRRCDGWASKQDVIIVREPRKIPELRALEGVSILRDTQVYRT